MAEKKRDRFGELVEGIDAMREHRQGKITLRTHKIAPPPPLPHVPPELIRATRESLRMSQSVFAQQLRINPRTLERWEQGRSKPNDQATVLILLLRMFPDMLDRLRELAQGGRVGAET